VIPSTWVKAYTLLPELLPVLMTGVLATIIITLGGLILAIALGLLFAVLRSLPFRSARSVAIVYVEVFRSIPVLTQLFIIYFGLAQVGIRLSPLTAAIVGFGINGGAYLTEVFRAGIEVIDRGQVEAGFTVGMTRLQTMRYLVLPQAIRVVLPPLGNFAIGLLKDTSVASAVAAPELSFRARQLVDQTFLSTQIYLMVAVLYLCLSLPLSQLTRHMERRMGRGRLA
jgi:polar amino acid transport system permease protein/cystine transport system permease protein